MTHPVEKLHIQIRDLRLLALELQEEKDRLVAEVARLKRDNRLLEDQLFDKEEPEK